ncbi:MAG: hypothetical protein ACK47B_17160 [Armatimonadota bacterium]
MLVESGHTTPEEEQTTLDLPGREALPPRRRKRRSGRRHGKPAPRKPEFSPEQILAWADHHFQVTGQWPTSQSGRVALAPSETWCAVDQALRGGLRGLSGDRSLARLLAEERGVRNRASIPPLTVEQILAWADAHHAHTGEWPKANSGAIPEVPGETWAKVNAALLSGSRGLTGDSSLARLLLEKRDVEHHLARPRLTVEQILTWIDAFYERHGQWPTHASGAVEDALGERWDALDNALRAGLRGLPGGSSVARLLAEHRGVRVATGIPPLTEAQILAWADAHFERHGCYPREDSGPVEDASGENWKNLDGSLRMGRRGLAGGSSLPLLLTEHRNCPYRAPRPPLTEAQILAWADAFHARHGRWPSRNSGPIDGAPGETWGGVCQALRNGLRGFPGDSSLAKLLRRKRGHRHCHLLPRLTEEQVLAWADAYHAEHGTWPRSDSGPIEGAGGDTWQQVNAALRVGLRGLPGGSSLAQLLQERRGVRNRKRLPPFTEAQIRKWALAHRARTGRWPTSSSGPVVDAPGETWTAVEAALRNGQRGLAGGTSLSRFVRDLDRLIPGD